MPASNKKQYITNPETGRKILKDGPTHQKLKLDKHSLLYEGKERVGQGEIRWPKPSKQVQQAMKKCPKNKNGNITQPCYLGQVKYLTHDDVKKMKVGDRYYVTYGQRWWDYGYRGGYFTKNQILPIYVFELKAKRTEKTDEGHKAYYLEGTVENQEYTKLYEDEQFAWNWLFEPVQKIEFEAYEETKDGYIYRYGSDDKEAVFLFQSVMPEYKKRVSGIGKAKFWK